MGSVVPTTNGDRLEEPVISANNNPFPIKPVSKQMINSQEMLTYKCNQPRIINIVNALPFMAILKDATLIEMSLEDRDHLKSG